MNASSNTMLGSPPTARKSITALHKSISCPINTSLDSYISLLQKPVPDRSSHDNTLLSNFLKRFRCFSSFIEDQDKLVSISKLVTYEYYSQGDAIFHRGESSNKAYIILKGSALVFTEASESSSGKQLITAATQLLDDENNATEEQSLSSVLKFNERGLGHLFKPKADRQLVRQQTYLGTAAKLEQESLLNQELRSKEEVERAVGVSKLKLELEHINFDARLDNFSNEQKLLVKVNSIRPGKYIKSGKFQYKPKRRIHEGECFGEVGILTAKSRVWTVAAEEDLHVLSISKQNYMDIYQEKLKQQAKNNEFLAQFFPEMDFAQLTRLCYLFDERQYVKNTLIFDDNQEVDSFYLIKEGQVDLNKNFAAGPSAALGEPRSPRKPKKLLIARIHQGEIFGDIEFFLGARSLCRAVAISSTVTLLKMKMDVFDELHKTLQPLFESFREASLLKAKLRREKIMSFIKSEETAAIMEGNKPVAVTTRNISPSPSTLPPLMLSAKPTPRNLDVESTNNRVKARREGNINRSEPKLSKSEHLHNDAKKLFLDLLKPDVLKKVLKRERGLNKDKHYCKKCMGKGHGDDEHSIGNDRDSIDDGDCLRKNNDPGCSTYLKRFGITIAQQESAAAMSQTLLVTRNAHVSPRKFGHAESLSLTLSRSSPDAVMKDTLMNKLRVRCISKHIDEKELNSTSDASSPTKRSPRLKPIRLTCDVDDPMINLKQLVLISNRTTYSMKTNYGVNTTVSVRGHKPLDAFETADRNLVRMRRSGHGNSPLIKGSMGNKSSATLEGRFDFDIGINGVMKDIDILKQSGSVKRVSNVWIKNNL